VVEQPERCAEVAALLATWFEGSVDLWQQREPG
jgi:hypothetical protein